ncbi:allograft inflammatory factor 1-like [Acanthaster planci]|uniref:Allograft inflammatory factor 1-like n=1 Tax=Acanthaster planci TaxID=133434 RepID=A0A8B7XWH3_ACAPL|nr:allograft inflammatory factor 1-like [Acanthaster planci]
MMHEKAYSDRKRSQEDAFAAYNKEIITSGKYSEDEYPDLEERLVSYKGMFMEFDENSSGDIDIMELKRMMEKLGQAKTHLELKKMITEVDTTNSGTIHYNEFIEMMLGKRNSILKLILMFEEKKQEKERPTGNPPKRDLEHLP